MMKGTKEGDRIKKLMCDGGIIPYEVVVQCLMTQMAAIQAKNYVIDGFPRAIDQCQHFEQHVCEVQLIIDYNIATDKMSKNL